MDTQILRQPPGRRLGCLALILDEAGRVLMVDPAYKAGFILPGGSARPDEAPNEAAARHVHSETGLVLDFWEVVAVDYVDRAELPEGINLVFSGGVLPQRRAERIKVPPVEESRLLGAHWVSQDELHQVTEPAQRARVIDALRVVDRGKGLPLLMRGVSSA
ncbi:NUDIX domain-containing protein [Kitasatospora sp. NPDC001574]